MQCQEELVPYKRVTAKRRTRQEKTKGLLSWRRLGFYAAAFLISRAIIADSLMPFGAAVFIAAFHALNLEAALMVGMLVAFGSASVGMNEAGLGNIAVVAIMMMAALFFRRIERHRLVAMASFAFVINLIAGTLLKVLMASGTLLLYDFLTELLESSLMVGMAYIFAFGIPIYFDNKRKRKLSREETVCLAFVLAVSVAGIWNGELLQLSLKKITSFLILLVAAYIEGPMAGAAFGVILGAVAGLSGDNLQMTGFRYGLCGLTAGLFKPMGKLTCAMGFLLCDIVVVVFGSGITVLVAGLPSVIVALAVFLLLPEKWMMGVQDSVQELNVKTDQSQMTAMKTRDLLGRKLAGITKTLDGLSEVLCQNIESELSYKAEISAMVEKLADRVCRGCSSQDSCWTKEPYHSFDAISELLRKNERCGVLEYEQMPKHLRYKCIRSNEMIRQSNYVYEMFKLNNKWRRKLVNSKVIVSEQMKGITGIMNSLAAEVLATMEFRSDVEEQLAIALDRNGLMFEDVSVARNGRGKYEVAIYRRHCEGTFECRRDFVDVVSFALERRMTGESGSCRVNEQNGICSFRFVEAENYSLATAVSKCAKEEVSGDCHTYGGINDGRYMLALSDGMGSGARAALESRTTIQLLEQFVEAGFDRSTTLKAINSVLVLRSNEECFATIDLGIIDLYSGVGEFVKVGSAPTFIKSGMEVEIVRATGIPAGILDDIEVESQIISFKSGDMIVMVSDGIVDADRELSERWITKALREYNSGNPKDVADYLLSKAKDMSNGSVLDDMTVIVSKIWKLY